MSALDVLARRHAAEAHAATAKAQPPVLDYDAVRSRVGAAHPRLRPVWVAVGTALLIMIAFAVPLLFAPSRAVDPAVTIPTPADGTGQFLPTGDLNQGCAWCPGVLLPDGNVFLLGGWSLEGDGRPPAELYHADSGVFTPTGVPNGNFSPASALLLEDGRVLVVSERSEIYDPASGLFQTTSITYPQGQGGTAATLNDGRVLLVFSDGSASIYDPAEDALTVAGSSAIQSDHHSATSLQDGRVLLIGPGLAEVFDPARNSFSPVDMATPRSGHTATRLLDGRVLIVGGGSPDDSSDPVTAAEIYDPATDNFVPTGSLNLVRFSHAAALLADGRVLIVGGSGGSMIGSTDAPGMEEYDHAEVYDPATGEFTLVTAPMTQARIAATAVTLNDGRVLIFGNYPGNLPSVDSPEENTAEVFEP